MDKNHGFVKIYRSIKNWGWYKDANTARVFIHCLISANFEDKEWMGRKIPRGSFVTSIKNLSKELKISVDKVRTAIEHLKITNEITCKGTSRYSVITVNKFNAYQQNPTQNPKQFPNNSRTNPKQIPTTKEYKEGKKERREEIHRIFEELRKEQQQ